MRFIFINRFYRPDEPATAQLLTDLAETLAAQSHSVTIIASCPAGGPHREICRGVNVRRVRATRCAARGLVGKVVDFATFYLGALVQLALIASRGDTVVALTDPPLIGIGAWVVARLSGAHIVHWVQDIYPEIAVALTGQTALNALLPLRNLAWRRSDACVTLGAEMAAVVAGTGVARNKILVSPNWAPAGLRSLPSERAEALRADWHLTGKFVALYCGNLGRVHDLEPLLKVAEFLRDHRNIILAIVGSGVQRPALLALSQLRQLTNVYFFPPQRRSQLTETLALGSVHFVTLRPGVERWVFPSKLYGVATAGRPVIFVGPDDCELAQQIREHDFGLTFMRDEAQKIAAAIVGLSNAPIECARLGAAAQRFAHANGGVDRAARAWAALAEKIAAP